MPGPYIHMSSMRHALENLSNGKYRPVRSERINPELKGADLSQLGKLLDEFSNFANIGAIGPDLFFFLPDFRDTKIAGIPIPTSSVLIFVLNFLENVYAAVDPYISKYEHYLGPISEDTAEEMSRLTGGLSEIVGDITGELSSILITLLEDFITQQGDLLSFFSLGLNVGYDDQAFFWSDMLHYRQTGQFGRTLWRKADAADDDGARAYALGYLTHLATDVTGHALVNSISGGPFRHHWQRHHLVENHMDGFWFLKDPDARSPLNASGYPQLTESALYFDIAFDEETGGVVDRPSLPGGNTLRENWTRKRLLDIDSELPDSIADLLVDAIQEIFYAEGVPHPKILRNNDGAPDSDQVKLAYDLFFRFLKLTTVDGFSHEPPPPPDVFPNLDFPTINDPAGDSAPGDDDGDGSFWDDLLDFILSVIRILAYIVEVAVYLATLPWAILADIVTYPLRLGLYYALELPLFQLLKNFRNVLVMSGYMLPMKDEISLPLIQVGRTEKSVFSNVLEDIGDIFGGLQDGLPGAGQETFRDRNYPHLHPSDEFKHPWQYPPAQIAAETPTTTASPYPRRTDPSELFDTTRANPGIRDGLENAQTPNEADAVDLNVQPKQHMGDSVEFSQYLIWLTTRSDDETQMVDWNLDADRGYGYHCWDFDRHPINDEFKGQPDPEGNLFAQPCTWPSQADHDLDPAAPAMPPDPHFPLPVKIHWYGPGYEDPGCHDEPPVPPIG